MEALRLRPAASCSLAPRALRNHARQLGHHARSSNIVSSHKLVAVAAPAIAGAPSAVDEGAVAKAEHGVCELDPKTFYDFISGGDLCVVDYYTGEQQRRPLA
jgi:hypothetical protein